MIIDVHSHNFPPALAARAMNGMCRQIEGRATPVGDGLIGTQLAHMARAGIDRAVACPIATKPGIFEGILRGAERILNGELGAAAQQKIVPFVSVHPNDPQALKQLETASKAGIRGVKFHSYYQQFALGDPKVWPVFAKIADLGLVTLCHCGEDVGWPDDLRYCGPREIEKLMKAVPGLKLIAAHLGGCGGYPVHETDRLLDCGVYIDTAMLHRRWHYDEEMRVLRSWPRERILFGTDFPWEDYREMISWVKSVRDPADWDLLFGGNACRLLSL